MIGCIRKIKSSKGWEIFKFYEWSYPCLWRKIKPNLLPLQDTPSSVGVEILGPLKK